MAYFFTGNDSQEGINYGLHGLFKTLGDMSLTMWVKYPAVGIGTRPTNLAGSYSADVIPLHPVRAQSIVPGVTGGWGVTCFHETGGSFTFGVDCVPGLLGSQYTLNSGVYMYFGFSRTAGTQFYQSYFGNSIRVLAGQNNSYPADRPPVTTVGCDFIVGTLGGNSQDQTIGPVSFWSRVLSLEEHQQVARCQIPTDQTGLLLYTKMGLGAIDLSSNMWTPTFQGTPLPAFVPDVPCQNVSAGQDYRLYNT